MAVTLHVQFPAGRYHATAWGHHVNEGVVDWPPAPLRVLRALFARSFACEPPPSPALLERLLAKLSSPPSYVVPPYTTGHTRHFMPDDSGKPDSRIKILDSFVAVAPDDTLSITWPDVALEDDELALLRNIAASLTYLGRAESWCETTVDTEPAEGAVGPGEGEGTPIPLLAPKRGTKKLLSLLATDTAELRKVGADLPSDTQWVRYFVGPPATGPRHRPRTVQHQAVLVSIEGGALPRVLDTVEIGNALRRAILSHAGDEASDTLTGRQSATPRRDQHLHAHYLPFDQRGDGFLRHALIFAPEGLRADELDAIAAVRVLRRPRSEPLTVRILETTSLEALQALDLVGEPSTVWTSATPFLLSRHPKPRKDGARDAPEDQLLRELAWRREAAPHRFPAVRHVERLPHLEQKKGRPLRWLEFRRWRGRHKPAVPMGYGFRIEFEAPVRGPLALGFGAHFGLGLFRPER